MSVPVITVINGANALSSAIVIMGLAGVATGDRVVQVIAISGPSVGSDHTGEFAFLAPENGTLVQNGSNLTGSTFIALLSRG